MPIRLAFESCNLVCVLAVACCLPTAESKADDTPPAAADAMIGKAAGQVRGDNGLKMKLVWCPPGDFLMGSPKGDPNWNVNREQVEVTLTNGYWMAKFEVTQSEWKQVQSTEPWKNKDLRKEALDDFTKEGDDFPVNYVSWTDAMEFCRKLTDRERKAGRLPEGWEYTLPTAAQWEYACRAGTVTRFSFGDDESKLAEYAWFNETVGEEYCPRRVGQKKPNSWGLYDMHGNVEEWCRDWYREGKPRGGRDPEVKNRQGQYACRVFRGGSWGGGAKFCQSAKNWGGRQEDRGPQAGFRVALSAVATK